MAAKGRKTGKPARPFRDYLYLAVAALAVVGLVMYAFGGEGQRADASSAAVPVTEISHVHGLAVDPARPGELLVATHYGLIRGTGEGGGWERVGPVQDYMGFTAHPAEGGVFWASGHPERGGNLGVIRSTDGGFTWERVALEGVDFHAMTVSGADPDVLWGYYRGELYGSTDGGFGWGVVNPSPPRIAALAGDAEEPDTLYASTDAGIQRSVDGGATFEPVAPVSALGLAAHPTKSGVLYAATAAGVERSDDGGANWTHLASGFGGHRPAYLALDPSAPEVVYLATYEASLHQSTDGGLTWRQIHPSST